MHITSYIYKLLIIQGPTHLIKLRHPRLLTVEHQVEESGDTLAFVSEPIFASLSNLLGHYDNMPSPLPLVIKVCVVG
jgi:SCY1-like protein 2